MKITQKLLPICFFMIVLAACDSGGDDPQVTTTGTVSGTVSSALDQLPVAFAEVTIGSQGARSAADGSYNVSNVPTGSALIIVEASGFDMYSENIQVQEGQNNHNIVLEKSIYERDPFTMYLPPQIEEVRGVIFFLSGNDGDWRPWIRGDLTDIFEAFIIREQVLEIMENHGLAFMGNDNSLYLDIFTHQTMLSGLEDFAVTSGRPELAHAPVYLFGYSRGANTAVNFAFNAPERTIGVYSYKGAFNVLDPNWNTIGDIPVFLHMGELDTGALHTIPEHFAPNREEGALWAAGIEKGVAHEMNPPTGFLTAWMEELIIARIPDAITPGTTPVLNVIDEKSGWLGDLNTFEVIPFTEFQGDPGSTSWFYSEEIAMDWQSIFR